MSSLLLGGKRVLVVGLGKSGLAACQFLSQKKANITLVDQNSRSKLKSLLKKLPRKTKLRLGKKQFPVSNTDLIVVSPGVPWEHPSLKKARKQKIPVWPELELGWRFVQPKKTIAITGTNGKTTTTKIIEALIKAAKRKVVVGGNIGQPLSSIVKKVSSKSILVLEVSSYQLEAHQTFHPNVGIWLNLTPDHLGRHRSMSRYAKIKSRMFSLMTSKDVAILNRKDKWCVRSARKIKPKKKWFPASKLDSISKFSILKGDHNKENVMAAILAAQSVGVSNQAIKKGLSRFKGVPHRLQIVGKKKGVTYINDSKSTNIDSTKVALKSMPKSIHLILGGRHKGTTYRKLLPFLKHKVKNIYAIGEAEKLIKKDLGKIYPVEKSKNLKNAVQSLRTKAKKGDVALLSPACASFDQYPNFEARGDHFIKLVQGFSS